MQASSSMQELQKRGYRLTPQRLAILNHLAGNTRHPSARDIYQHLRAAYPTLSLATVYNTLSVLTAAGLVKELKAGGNGVRYDANPVPHANLYCRQCHRIIDVPLAQLPEIEKSIRHNQEFAVDSLNVEITGTCGNCLRAAGGNRS